MVCKKVAESVIVPPTIEQLEITRNETNETSIEKLNHNVRLIEEWAKYQNHFPRRIEKCFIKGFLRGCRHNLDKTKKKLEHYLTARSLYPEVYSNRSPYSKDIIQIMDTLNVVTLPQINEKGQRLWIFKLERPDVKDFSMAATVKLFFMMYDFLMTSEDPTNGEVAIFDGSYFSASHLSKFIACTKYLTALLREAYAIRLKKIHIVNAPNMLEKLMVVVKPLLHQNVRNSFVIHKNVQDLADHIDPELLPSCYGGNQKDLRHIAEDWYEVLADNADWFEKQENMKISGPVNKKIENTLYFKDQIGVEGSFRKLAID